MPVRLRTLFFILSFCFIPQGSSASAGNWGHYRIQEQVKLGTLPGATYFRLSTSNGSTAHVIEVDMPSGNWELKPVFGSPMAGTATFGRRHDATAAINGGFFAFGSGASVGYIMTDGKVITDPSKSSVITGNSNLNGWAAAVLNRSEVRFLSGFGPTAQIAARNDPMPTNVKHVLQAGPRLLPQLASRQEAFIRGSVDAISCNGRAQRTAIGITPQGSVMLACIDGRRKSCPGVTLKALSEFLQDLGCTQALNFDGGGSTTMYIRPNKSAAGTSVCTTYPQRPVASVLLLLEQSQSSVPPVAPAPIPTAKKQVQKMEFFLPAAAQQIRPAGMHSPEAERLLQVLRQSMNRH